MNKLIILQLLLAAALGFMRHGPGLFYQGQNYTPFSSTFPVGDIVWDEGYFYAEAANAFAKHGEIGTELDCFESRNLSNTYPPLGALLAGLLARMVGSIELAWLLLPLLLIPFSWFLLFWLSRTLVKDKLMACAVAWIVVLFGFGPRAALLLSPYSYENPIRLTRYLSPGLTFPLFILFCLSLAHLIATGSKRAAGLTIGLAASFFYLYYFNWIVAALMLITAAGIFAMLREKRFFFSIFTVGILSAIAAIPSFLRVRSAYPNVSSTLLLRMGGFSREVWVPLLLLGIIFLVSAFFLARRYLVEGTISEKPTLIFVLLLAVAGAGLGANIHVLTGYDAQHATHMGTNFITPIFILLFFLALVSVAKGSAKSIVWPGVSGFAVLLIVMGFYRQWHGSMLTMELHRKDSDRNRVLEFLSKKIPERSVVGSGDREFIAFIPSLTGHWSFVPSGLRTISTTEEISLRFAMVTQLTGGSADEVLSNLGTPIKHSTQGHYSLAYTLYGAPSLAMEDVADVRKVFARADLNEALVNRRMDYLIVAQSYEPQLFRYFPKAKAVYSNQTWKILKLQ